jgi:hypothetical protein
MQGWQCHAKVEVSTDEREQAGCGEATLLAEDSGRGSDEWDIDAGVLPAATFAGHCADFAAVRSLLDASVLIPMAQMKPSNSRPTAAILPRYGFRTRVSEALRDLVRAREAAKQDQ